MSIDHLPFVSMTTNASSPSRPAFRFPATRPLVAACLVVLLAGVGFAAIPRTDVATYVRVNQIGYLPDDNKVAIAFSVSRIRGRFEVIDEATGTRVYRGTLRRSSAPGWGRFDHYYELDFTPVRAAGNYIVRLENGAAASVTFAIGENAYGHYQEDLLEFMRQQRCGYNPTLDMVCHRKDGRSFYGPMPDSSFVDVSGGWHDAGDQLKYLMTSSNATARLLLAYRLAPEKFGDTHDAMGRTRANGRADVLDEARWGLDWLFKIHPAPDQLIHQVADDRDHRGWKWPNEDISDYGWGQNSYRPAYFATGGAAGPPRTQEPGDGCREPCRTRRRGHGDGGGSVVERPR
jgi:endoglucanase